MPKETFFNLHESKRDALVNELLWEFAYNSFETASINQVIKKLGIARGSIYQYFEDKLAIWLYLKEYAEQKKTEYIQSVDRTSYPDFWTYYEALYMRGIDFDLEQPECSVLLHRIHSKESNEILLPYLDDWKIKARTMFSMWVDNEKRLGNFSKDLPTDTIVHFLLTMSMSIVDLMQGKYKVDFESNLKSGKPLFAENKEELRQAVKDLLLVLRRALS